MNYMQLHLLKRVTIQHRGNSEKGITWDYHVECSDFVVGDKRERESETGRVGIPALCPGCVTSLCPSFSICGMGAIFEPTSWDCFVD